MELRQLPFGFMKDLLKKLKFFSYILLYKFISVAWKWAPCGINDYDDFFFVAMKIFANPSNRW